LEVVEMIVDNVVENDDGTADIDLHLNKDELNLLIQEGLISLLTKYIAEEEVAKRTPALLKAAYGKPNE
jgi:hypothetical protein